MLDSLRGRARVFFDVKPGAPVAPLVALVRAKGFGGDKSFFWFADTAMLKEFTRLAPEMKVKVNASDVKGIRRWMGVCRPSYVEIAPGRITGEVRDFCRRNGIRIMAAVQGEEEAAYKEAIVRQPDLVNLDRPELFAKVMADIDEEERIRRRPLAGYVDPRIGSEGLGRVFVGPSWPFGMAKPSPDCTVHPNSGWLPMPEQVDGFAQVHVSGTGGGPKYGNILVMPFAPAADDTLGSTSRPDRRKTEEIALGYYATELAASGGEGGLTAARRASFYRFTYPPRSAARAAGGRRLLPGRKSRAGRTRGTTVRRLTGKGGVRPRNRGIQPHPRGLEQRTGLHGVFPRRSRPAVPPRAHMERQPRGRRAGTIRLGREDGRHRGIRRPRRERHREAEGGHLVRQRAQGAAELPGGHSAMVVRRGEERAGARVGAPLPPH